MYLVFMKNAVIFINLVNHINTILNYFVILQHFVIDLILYFFLFALEIVSRF